MKISEIRGIEMPVSSMRWLGGLWNRIDNQTPWASILTQFLLVWATLGKLNSVLQFLSSMSENLKRQFCSCTKRVSVSKVLRTVLESTVESVCLY